MSARTEFRAAYAAWRKYHLGMRAATLKAAADSGRPIPDEYTKPYVRDIAGRMIQFSDGKLVGRGVQDAATIDLWRCGIHCLIVGAGRRLNPIAKRRTTLELVRSLRD